MPVQKVSVEKLITRYYNVIEKSINSVKIVLKFISIISVLILYINISQGLE